MRPGRTLHSAYLVFRREQLDGTVDATHGKYLTAIEWLRTHLEREPLLSDLTDANLRSLLAAMQTGGLSASSANAVRSKIVRLWAWCCTTGRLRVGPTVKRLVEPEQAPIAWRPEQLAKLWDAAGNAPGAISGIPAGDWWLALLSVLYETGERIGAALQLTWADVDGNYVTFRAETRKGGRKVNVKPLSGDAMRFLNVLPRTSETVFPWTLTREMLWVHYRAILKSAGLPHDRKRMFHCLRKTHASLLEAAGGDGTKSLGHSERRTTAAYLDPRLIGTQRPCDLLPRPQ